MKLGKFTIDMVDTGIFGLDGGAMFGVVPKAIWAKAYAPGDALNRIPLAARPLLIRWENNVLIIDTGNGNKMDDKFSERYGIDKNKSSIVSALKKFGVKREDVTHVVLTHLHFDHAGGATIIENNELQPTFQNAKYYVQKQHLDWALHPTEKDRASFNKADYEPLLAGGMLETTDGEGELMEGISVIPLFGHTKCMQAVKISDDGETYFFCADLCPTSAHIPVPYVMGYDNNPLTVIEEKKRILAEAYEDKWTLCFEHDAFVQASKIVSNEKGFSKGETIKISDL